MKRIALIVLALTVNCSWAKLPPETEAEKLKSSENAARQAWSAKQDAYNSCRAQDRVVNKYQEDLRARGQAVPPAAPTGACADPGPYPAMGTAAPVPRPLEASGATSPPATAVGAPSGKTLQSDMPKK